MTRCGGCPWQAADYKAQLRWKRDALVELVRRVQALSGVTVSQAVGMADPYGYRTKIQMPVGGRPGALEVGFYRAGSKDLGADPPDTASFGSGHGIAD